MQELKQQILSFGSRFETFLFLDSNGLKPALNIGTYDWVAAIGAQDTLVCECGQAFDQLKNFHQNEWVFGYLGYDLKNEIEHLSSSHPNNTNLPPLFFFKPLYLVYSKNNEVYYSDPALPELIKNNSPQKSIIQNNIPTIHSRIHYQEYLEKIAHIKNHILHGDVYEMNFCLEFFSEGAIIDPLATWQALNETSPTPFASYLQHKEFHLLCASPERFLTKINEKIFAQPIKGTIQRGLNAEEDLRLKNELQHNEKERSENIMIVDLLRNDLAKSSETGSVSVNELCGIYTFEQVHQMISTVSSTARAGLHFTDIIRHAFPMGSMTGCPKIEAMKLIEVYEKSRRGIYSGSVGYISPEGNFDLNVVIRSIVYNSHNKYLSFQVGSAITHGSVAEQEFEECLLKAKAIRQVLSK
jgi:para-aminobenzoate synthetase component 1